jgi:phenylalanyl-tRNA synthetase beta chain
MKLSLDWLSDFVAFNEKDPQKIAEALTLGVAEVEKVEVQGELLEHCCVGKVLTVKKHPNADKLFLCDVETDKGKKRVVCGGTNLREEMFVAFAHCGATVKWHGEEMMELKKTNIRGEESEGMICAAEELDLSAQFPNAEGRNIIDLEGELFFRRAQDDKGVSLQVGQSLKDALGLNDVIFHINNHSITHRADLFSHTGFARECFALGLGTWKGSSETFVPAFSGALLPFKLHIEAQNLVPRYMACGLRIDALGKTPDWMKKRLAATGWRSVNVPIDITNYVLMEMGSPLHSFDADDFRGDIHVRTSKKGERVTTLDGVERELPDGALVISDNEGVFDLLGIMGGLRSSTKDNTQNIYLQSASLDPISIRKAIIATGHRTDGATVYEKGVPPSVVGPGLFRAIELFIELVPGAKIISSLEEHGKIVPAESITLSLSHASSLLGREITKNEATKALTALDFVVSPHSCDSRVPIVGENLEVIPPLNRLGDIRIQEDVIEEIARIIGFKYFEEELPSACITPPPRDQRIHILRDTLKESAFTELVQFSFVGEDLLKKAGYKMSSHHANLQEIQNPLGEDIKFMRPSLLPRLLEFAEENMRLVDDHVKVFEVGHTFSGKDEVNTLTLLIADKRSGGIKNEPFLLAKSITTEFLHTLNARASFAKKKKQEAIEHPGRSMSISVQKKEIGSIFEIHPSICSAFNLPHRAAAVVINLDALLTQAFYERVYGDTFEFPSIEYDTTITLSPDIQVGPLLTKAQGSHEFLREISLIDLYQKGHERKLTLRCTYNAGDRTLTEEEVKPIQERVEATLQG